MRPTPRPKKKSGAIMTTWYDEVPPIPLMPDERWVPVAGNERLFSISDHQARIYSWYHARLLKGWMQPHKGLQVKLRDKSYRVAHLVLESFGFPQPRSTYAAHANNDRSDCSLQNLFWRPVSELQKEISARRPRTHCTRCGHELTVIGDKRRCLECRPLPEVIEAEA